MLALCPRVSFDINTPTRLLQNSYSGQFIQQRWTVELNICQARTSIKMCLLSNPFNITLSGPPSPNSSGQPLNP